MISSTLLNILSKLSAKEYKEFGEFVNSPFFNKNKNVKKLYDFLKKFHPEFENKKITKEHIHEKIFGKTVYNDGFMRTVIYNLGKLAEDYLAYKNSRNDDLDRGIGLLKELNERKLEKVFLRYYSEIEEDLEKTKYRGPAYYLKKYQLHNEMEIYMDWSKFKHKDYKNYTDKTITYIDDDLTSFYLSKALSHYRFLLDKANYEQIEYKYDFIDHIMEYLLKNENHFISKTKIKLHLYEVLLLKENEEKYYTILKDILINERDQLNHSDRYSLHNILQSFCVNREYKVNKDFLEERYELYKICVEQGLYAASEHIYIDDLVFGNIAKTAITSKAYDWAEDFISTFSIKLSPDSRELVANYALARLNFGRKLFENSLRHLSLIKSVKHIQYKLPIRDLTLMVYYELSQTNQAHYQIDSYRHFLTNNKKSLSDSRFERISNFLKYFTRLVKLKEKRNPAELRKLKAELDETLNVLERKWLNEKVKELVPD
ncbi:MAG: hypothetical protein IT281_01200 [Ignavibacteria bacterium]|nr:hypothetical protein [Ignavibacteria bacterium]